MSGFQFNVLSRAFLFVVGVICILSGLLADTRIGGLGKDNKRPVTSGQRLVLLVFGSLFALWGLMGWVS